MSKSKIVRKKQKTTKNMRQMKPVPLVSSERKEFIKNGRTRTENFNVYERKRLCTYESKRNCYDYEGAKKRV